MRLLMVPPQLLEERESAAASKAYNQLGASGVDQGPGHKGADSDFSQPCLKCAPWPAVGPAVDSFFIFALTPRCKTCPGFNMHPWRKTCKWCRCSRAKCVDGVRLFDGCAAP